MYFTITIYKDFLPNFSPVNVISSIAVFGFTTQPISTQVKIPTIGIKIVLLT